tara:strand:+ start:1273 stop:2718 length:1446 start_codon:yes stop_codon:yes gene_type:complete
MDSEYIGLFNKYHKEKFLFLSNKDKYIKCKNCENKKKFIEKDNILVFSCGSENKECGEQIRIELPKYIHYDDKFSELHKKMNGSFDYTPDHQYLLNYNLDHLQKHFKIEDEYKKQTNLIDESKNELDFYKTKFIELNQMNEKMKDIQELYQLKRKESIQKQKLLNELKDKTTTDERKIEIKKEYALLIFMNKNNIYPLLENLNQKNKLELQIQDPIFKTTLKKEKIDIVLKKEEEEKEDHRGYEFCKKLAENKINKKDIETYRKKIKKKIIKKVGKEITLDNFTSLIGDKEMKYIFGLYDKYFFKNKLSKLAEELECMWTICWNHRCTKVSGKQYCDIKGKCKTITIELSSKVFKNVIEKMIKDGNDYITMDSKNRCDSILSCMVLTFEHELVHGLQTCFCSNWKTSRKGPGDWTGRTGPGSGHSKTFMSILNNTFGHVDYQHSLFSAGHKDESNKKKGIGDELEEFQVELFQEISKAEKK